MKNRLGYKKFHWGQEEEIEEIQSDKLEKKWFL